MTADENDTNPASDAPEAAADSVDAPEFGEPAASATDDVLPPTSPEPPVGGTDEGTFQHKAARGALPTAVGGSVVGAIPGLENVDPEAARAALADVPWEPGAPKPDPILVADSVVRRFGGLTAVDVDHVEIQRGVITALIGPNGAGKTTLFNLLTNFDKPDSGTRMFDGKSIDKVPAHKIASHGMVRTFQLTKVLSKMTVIENMKLGASDQRGESLLASLLPFLWQGEEAEIEKRADELLVYFKMDHMRDQFAGTLSGGQRKLLEMARSLMVNPKMVMLDEPMAGVNPALTQSLLGHVTGLRDQGMSVLFVEHDMDMVQEISDWVVVMAEGKIIAEGPPSSIAGNQAVVDAYLGSSHDSALDLDKEL